MVFYISIGIFEGGISAKAIQKIVFADFTEVSVHSKYMSENVYMITFDQCSYCSQAARIRHESCSSAEREKSKAALTHKLFDTGIKVTVNDRYYHCQQCGTYYRFETDFFGTIGYFDMRLVRLTIIEAMAAFQSDFKTAGDFSKAYNEAKASGLWRINEIRKLLKTPLPSAREFAAETLADLYKSKKKTEKIRELLQNPDAEIRLGALWSYAEIPWRQYSFDSPRLDTYNGLFQYKPFGKLSSVLSSVLKLIYDPDERIRKIATGFINNYFYTKGEVLLAKLRRIPEENRTAEVKSLLIEHIYPGKDNQSFIELCNFMIDANERIRQLALNRIYEWYNEAEIPKYIDYIKKLSKKCPNAQTQWFLEHPYAGLEYNNDDD